MKKAKWLLMIFAALLVAQTSKAQVEHQEFIEDPGFIYCLDEPVYGQLHYRNTFHYDKLGNVTKMFFHNTDSWFEGAISRDMYKVVDLGTAIPDYLYNFEKGRFPIPADGFEFEIINNMKIISKGNGKVYSARAQIKLVMYEGGIIAKKSIETTCF